jgi:peptidoglycan/xylan/chitin deacetylase (PgdA/CDA1 family)
MVQLRRYRVLAERTPGSFPIPAPVRRAAHVGLTCALLLLLLPAGAGVAQAAGETIVSLTFNDGQLSQYTNARPVLQAHNMNATFYVVSGWADKNASGYVQWWQVDDLYRDGNEIGGMGTDHKDLTQVYNSDWTQDYAYKRQQVCDDRQRLAQRGYDPQSFAYPAGAYNYTFPDGSTVRDIVKGCGYLAARSVGALSPTGPTYAETLPPKDAYAIRTWTSSTTPIQLSALQSMVTAAASRGGGWVPLVFNQVCHQGQANYSTCMSSSKAIDDAVFSVFLDWLQNAGQTGGAPTGTVVKTVRQAMGAPPQPTLPPRPTVVSLTFDDGLVSQHRARSMFSSHSMPATFFITTGDVDAGHPCCMTWSQIGDLANDGNEIGGHTVHHVNLKDSSLSYQQKVHEVCDDRQRLIDKGFNPVSFAYPYAAFDQTAKSIVQSCGYQSARTGGSVSTGGLYAELIPPRDPYATRAVTSTNAEISLSSLTSVVNAAATHGGGWLQFQFHEVCSQSRSDYSTCMSTWGPIQDTTLNAFLDWLQDSAPSGTVVQTVEQAMSRG